MENSQSDLVTLEVCKFHSEVFKWVSEATTKSGFSDWFSPVTVLEDKIIATDGVRLHFVDISSLPSNPFPLGRWIVKTIRKDVIVLKKFVAPTIQEPDLQGAIQRALTPTFKLPSPGQEDDKVWKLSFAMNGRYLRKSLKLDWTIDHLDVEIIGQPVFTLHVSYGMYTLQLRAIIAPLLIVDDARCMPFCHQAVKLAPADYSLEINKR